MTGFRKFLGFVIDSGGSGDFWMNFLFIVIIFTAICMALQWNLFKKMFSGDSWIKLK